MGASSHVALLLWQSRVTSKQQSFNYPQSSSPPSLSNLKKFLSPHLPYLCCLFFTWLAQEIRFILKVISFNWATNRSEYNCPQSFPRRIHAWVASNKEGPCQLQEGAHNQLHRGSSIEKTPCIVQSPFYNSTFPFNDTLHINPGQHPITQNKWIICASMQFENVFHAMRGQGRVGGLFSSSQRSLKCELVSYFGSINSKYRWFAAPLYTGPPRFPVMECYRGVEWHQHNWFDELSSPGQHSTKQTGRATNSAPFIFNYSLLTSLTDNVTPGKNGGGICCEKIYILQEVISEL